LIDLNQRWTLQLYICLMLSALWLASPGGLAQSVADREVLDLWEAADLLRVAPDVVRGLAESNRIPARRVGDEWRFWRAALMQWLKGEASVPSVPLSDLAQAVTLQREMPNVTARGLSPEPTIEAEPQSKVAGSSTGSTTDIGEHPTGPTSEDIALRDQGVLLPRGSGTIELGMAYARSEQTLLPVIRVEQSDFDVSGTVRYGVMNNLQLTMRAPATWRNTKTFVDASVTGTNLPGGFTMPDSMAQDASISVLGVGWRESVRWPTLIWSLDSTLPLGPGDRGFGGGLVVSKSYDPAVLFAGLTYLYGQRINPSDSNSSLAKHNYGFQTGYTYALNDSLALSGALFGTYRDTRSPDGIAIPPPRQNYTLQLGTTWLLAPGLFVEPAVAMRVGGDTPGLTLLLNISHSFLWRGKP